MLEIAKLYNNIGWGCTYLAHLQQNILEKNSWQDRDVSVRQRVWRDTQTHASVCPEPIMLRRNSMTPSTRWSRDQGTTQRLSKQGRPLESREAQKSAKGAGRGGVRSRDPTRAAPGGIPSPAWMRAGGAWGWHGGTRSRGHSVPAAAGSAWGGPRCSASAKSTLPARGWRARSPHLCADRVRKAARKFVGVH